jgi:hypothetical protein
MANYVQVSFRIATTFKNISLDFCKPVAKIIVVSKVKASEVFGNTSKATKIFKNFQKNGEYQELQKLSLQNEFIYYIFFTKNSTFMEKKSFSKNSNQTSR